MGSMKDAGAASVDISQRDHPAEPCISLLSRGRGAADVLQCEKHLSVSQRLPAAAAGRSHDVLVI